MSGRQYRSGRGSARITSDLNWQFAGIGDLNGDRMDDVLLRHADGRWYYYPMDGRLHLRARGASNLSNNLDWYLPTLFRSVPGFQGPQQTYLQTSEFPHELIRRERDRGLFITSISRSDDYWNALMSRSVGGIDGQSIHVSSSFPEDGIDAAWDSGQDITEVAYGDGRWVVVTSSGTPLYDAVRTAVRYTVDRANNSNRVVIVFTDGEDTSNRASLDDAIATANQNNVPLHTIALASGVDLGVLSQMAGRTGGALARASDAKRLISYYGALGPFLSGWATFYRTSWKMSFTDGSRSLGSGSWVTSCVRVSAPGGTICLPFRLDFN